MLGHNAFNRIHAFLTSLFPYKFRIKDFGLIREHTGPIKPVFCDILRSVSRQVSGWRVFHSLKMDLIIQTPSKGLRTP